MFVFNKLQESITKKKMQLKNNDASDDITSQEHTPLSYNYIVSLAVFWMVAEIASE